MEVFETDDGTMGFVVFTKSRKVLLRLGKPGAFQDLEFPLGLPSPIVIQGKRGELLLGDMRGRTVRHQRIDIRARKRVDHTTIRGPLKGGKLPSNPMFSQLIADAKNRYALVGCERGQLLTAHSSDHGKNWTPLTQIGVNLVKDDQICPPMMKSPAGLHIVHVAESGDLVHLLSMDGGRSFRKAKGQPSIAAKHGAPFLVSGYGTRSNLHLVCLTKDGVLVHVTSQDRGSTWTKGRVISKNRPSDLGSIFQVRGNGKVTALSFTEPGKSDLHSRRAHLFVHHHGSESWTEMPLTEGILGDTGRTCIFINHRSGMLAGFTVGPAEGKKGGHHVLLRRFAPLGHHSKPLSSEERTRADAWISILASESRTTTADTEARKGLTELGLRVLPRLLRSTARIESKSASQRLEQLSREIRLAWTRDSKRPEWWKD